jgi:hypothetical protein
MQTNPYEDDRPLPWIPQQNQFYEGGSNRVRSNQQPLAQQYQGIQQRGGYQTSKPLERMPKVKALELVSVYKKRLIVASLVVFGLLSGLVAYHQVGTAANQGQVDPSQSVPATQPSNGSFFDQQGGNNFGSSNPGQPQPPASGSGVS